MTQHSPSVLVTGASSGIGRATALAFAKEGWSVAVGARRQERIAALLPELEESGAPKVFGAELDVCNQDDIESFLSKLEKNFGPIDCLVNNAGKALGLEKLFEAEGSMWREMIETNVMGVLHMTRALLPGMMQRKRGHVIMVGSVAGHHGYAGASVYCASKRALWSLCESMRRETLGQGIRVTTVDPGLVDTEFSPVRFEGDEEKAAKVYEGLEPLHAEDVAECILFAATRKAHVNLDRIQVMPTIQADPWHIHRDK
ncbi:MAG: NAD(P)-dependent oxidoreductase [Planctomycetota bacterium]|nr:MAG: NAD(P)-dependent oxidoreductase [Planctomycetota bacterium]